MTLTRDQVADTLRQALHSRSELELALLFGSVARDRAGSDSDVDLAVRGREVDLLGLSAELGALLGVEVDVVSLEGDLPIALFEELLRDAVCVHEGAPGAYAAFRSRAMWAVETDGALIARMNRAWLAHLAGDAP